jgi:putative phage-type endonuclease
MQIHNCEQRSPEWYELRKKYPLTASEAQCIGNQGKGLETLCWKKMAEKYSSSQEEGYTNQDLNRGVELEPQARDIYELETGNKTEVVGFITNENISKVGGASPDSLVGDDGLVEIKCFIDVKHLKAICNGLEIESEYQWQMQQQLLFTGRKWVDFVAYNPNFEKALLIVKVYPDLVMQEKIKTGLAIGEKIINDIEKKYGQNK